MSEENLEVIRAIYAAWDSGHLGRRYMAPEVEYVNPPDALEGGTLAGADSFNSVFEVYSDVEIEVDELIPAGEKVVMLGSMRGRARATGLQMRRPHMQVWTLRDGKAARMQWFHTAGEALRAAGLPERGSNEKSSAPS